MFQLQGGFGDALDSEIDGFLLRSPNPSSSAVADFLRLYSGEARDEAGRRLIAKGVSANAVSSALTWLDASGKWNTGKIWGVLSIASGAVSAYHGYKRNNSLGWGIWWFIMGTVFPVITPAIGLAQGLGKRKAG